MAERNSFIFYHEFAEYLTELSGDEAKALINAIIAYDRDGVIPEFGSELKMAFIAIRIQIDKDRAKWDNTCQVRSEAGKRGGAPKGNKNAKTSKTTNSLKNKQKQTKQTKQADNDCECDSDNDYEGQEIKDYCAEPENPPPAPEPRVMSLSLNDGTEYQVTAKQEEEWVKLYPAVDVRQELRNMCGWLIANPTKRKTRRGILRFINGWLAREQDKGGSSNTRAAPGQSAGKRHNDDYSEVF